MYGKVHHTILQLFSWRQFYIQVLLVSAVTSVLSGGMLIKQNVEALHLEQQRHIYEIEYIADVITPLVQGFDLVSLEAIGEGLFSRSYVHAIRITDRSGYPLFERKGVIQSTHTLQNYAADLILRDTADKPYKAGHIYVDIIAMDSAEIYKNATVAALNLFLVISALGIATSSIYAKKNITRPLRELSRAIDQTLATGQPAKTADISTGFIGQFQKQFNSMQDQLLLAQVDIKRQRQLIHEALRSVQQSVRLYDCGTYVDYNRTDESFQIPPTFPQTHAEFKEYCSAFGNFELEKCEHDLPNRYILYDLNFSLNENWHNVKAIQLGEGVHALILTNITRAKTIEKTLEHAQRMELVGSLSSGIAHDFNNVLGIMVGHLELMGIRLHDPEKVEASRSKALAASRRGAAIVNSLLAFSRKNVERINNVMAADVLESIVSISRSALGTNIQLYVKTHMNALLNVDVAMLESSLINLLVNARDAMPKGGKVILTSRPPTKEEEYRYDLRSGKHIVLSVTDEGTGIPEQHFDQILESFHTTKDQGTGLGLSMVKNYTDQAGGILTFGNNPGRGATFAMILPIETSREFRLDVIAESHSDKEESDADATVLILEDEAELLSVLTDLLENWGYKCVGCRSLEEARRYHEAAFDNPEIILTDLNLGDGSGDLLHSNQYWKWHDIPKILMSGNMEHAGLTVDVAQFSAFIMKPFEVDQIRNVLLDAMSERLTREIN